METLNSVAQEVAFYGRIVLDVLGALVVVAGVAAAVFFRRMRAAEEEADIECQPSSWGV